MKGKAAGGGDFLQILIFSLGEHKWEITEGGMFLILNIPLRGNTKGKPPEAGKILEIDHFP